MHVAHFTERDHGRTFDVVHGAGVAGGDEAPNGGIVPGTHGGGKSHGRKSEFRRPKSERRPKLEIRSITVAFGSREAAILRDFGFRGSAFFRISAFGFRILKG